MVGPGIEECIDVHQPRTGKQPFPGHASEAFHQTEQQSGLKRIGRGEIRVPPFGGKRFVMILLPDQDADTQAGTGADHDPGRPGHLATLLQHRHIGGNQRLNAISHGLEVIEQPHTADAEAVPEHSSVYLPGQIGEPGALAVIRKRSGNSETRAVDRSRCTGSCRCEKLVHHRHETIVGVADKTRLRNHPVRAWRHLRNLEQRLGTTDIASQHPHSLPPCPVPA